MTMQAEQLAFPVDAVAPALASHIVFGPAMRVGSRTVHHVKDRRQGQFYRVGPREQLVLSLFDGARTFAQISAEHRRVFGKEIPPSGWRQILQLAHSRQMLAAPGSARETVSAKPLSRFSHTSYTAFYVRLLRPQLMLDWLDKHVGWLYSQPVALVLLSAIFLSELFVGLHLHSLVSLSRLTLQHHPWPVLTSFALLLYASLVVHETAHGLTCVHYGGEVNDMGIMLRYLALFPYCKLNDLLVIRQRSHRAAIVVAGPAASLIIMTPFVPIFWLAADGSLMKLTSALMLTVFNVLSLANLVPFLQLDGYLLLSTYLGRPKLREEATQQFLHGIGLSRAPSPDLPGSKTVRVGEFAYGLVSLSISGTFIGWGIFSWHLLLCRFTSSARAWLVIAILCLSVGVVWTLIYKRKTASNSKVSVLPAQPLLVKRGS